MKTIDGQFDLFDDGKIVLVPLPGHTPGTMGALVKLDRSGEFLLASDAASYITGQCITVDGGFLASGVNQ